MKYLSFLLIFIPWLFSPIIVLFVNKINSFILFYLLLLIILYIFMTIFIYKTLYSDNYNKDFLLNVILFYISNQSFNLMIFYYNNLLSSILFSVCQILIFVKILLNYKT